MLGDTCGNSGLVLMSLAIMCAYLLEDIKQKFSIYFAPDAFYSRSGGDTYRSTPFPFQQLASLLVGAENSSLLQIWYGRFDQNLRESLTFCLISFTNLSKSGSLLSSVSSSRRFVAGADGCRFRLFFLRALLPAALSICVSFSESNFNDSNCSSRLFPLGKAALRLVRSTTTPLLLSTGLSSNEKLSEPVSKLYSLILPVLMSSKRPSSSFIWNLGLMERRRRPNCGRPQPWNTCWVMSWPVSCMREFDP